MEQSENKNLIYENKRIYKKKLIAGVSAISSFLLFVLIDQITKYLIDHTMDLYDSIAIFKNIFEIHYIRNSGAAWGLLEGRQILFYICTIFIFIVGIMLYIRCLQVKRYRDIQVSLILILSGAMGNFIDRVRFQYVIDFLYFKLIDFPVFNIADCYITIGFLLMLILFLFKYKEEDIEYLMQNKSKSNSL